jgi:hypothetical protein
MAFFALGGVAELSFAEHKLHPHLAAARAEKLLRDDPDPRILAQNLGHMPLASFLRISASLFPCDWFRNSGACQI